MPISYGTSQQQSPKPLNSHKKRPEEDQDKKKVDNELHNQRNGPRH